MCVRHPEDASPSGPEDPQGLKEAPEGYELIEYLEDNWEGLYGSWSLKGKVKGQEVLLVPRPLARWCEDGLASSGQGRVA